MDVVTKVLSFTASAGILLEHAPACPEQYGVQVNIIILYLLQHLQPLKNFRDSEQGKPNSANQ